MELLMNDFAATAESEKMQPGKKQSKKTGSVSAVPSSAVRMAKIGGSIALFAAAAISAQTLVSLGHTIGLHGRVAWLLPTSLDVYAATAIWVGYRIPAAHPASVVARRDARLALSLTVCCNVLYHLLVLVGSELPKVLTDPLLLCVGALPPLVVERIFHLQMAVRDGGKELTAAADAGRQTGSGNEAAADTGAAAATEAAMPAAKVEPIAAPATGPSRYFTGGDLPGTQDPGFPAWHAVEPALAPIVGPVDVTVGSASFRNWPRSTNVSRMSCWTLR